MALHLYILLVYYDSMFRDLIGKYESIKKIDWYSMTMFKDLISMALRLWT